MKFQTKKIDELTSSCTIIFIFEDNDEKSNLFNKFDELTNGELSKQIYDYKVINGKYLETFKYSIDKTNKVIVTGLGKKSQLTRKKLSIAITNATRQAKANCSNGIIGIELITNSKEGNMISEKDSAQISLTASRIGLYTFNKYISDKNNENSDKIETIELICNDITKDIELGAEIGAFTSFAMKFTKDLVNESAQIVTPRYVANLAEQIAHEHKLEAKIYNKAQIKDLGMNAFLAVGQGSCHEPYFVHLTYKPKSEPKRKIALVGKGITFDAGGMNIKPATSMLNMKDDMTGAASVLGIIQAIAKLKPDIELHVITALCENMTSGTAYKQGDVLEAMNGKTIEVTNTDAEGRITLADALSYCNNLEVDEVIDIATLTGAVITALGTNITGIMGNNQKQIDNFKKIAEYSCENVWQMPIFDELKDNLKSEIADFKNTGGKNAGTSTAAWFLSNFTNSKSWLHLDIAGTAYLEKSNKETLQGPTGVMIRSLINYILS